MATADAMIHSYDVFDTIVVRSCGDAHEVFTLLAEDILGKEAPESAIRDFSYARIKAESEARKTIESEEVTIEDIYNLFPLQDFGIENIEIVMKREMEIEHEQTIAVEKMRHEIKLLHDRGESVYYISDMYLPDEWFMKMLRDKGFWKEGDKLYVSASTGATKRTGTLYDLIAKENKIAPGRWIHSGDNKYSDIRMARKKGIRTKHITHNYSNIEKRNISESFTGHNTGHLLAAASRAVRLSGNDDSDYLIGAEVIAPLFTGFVASVMEDAQNKGVDKLCFLARDGRIFYEIALALAPLYPSLKSEYVKMSRTSLYLPGLERLTANEIMKLAQHDFKGNEIYSILKNFLPHDVLLSIQKSYPQPEGKDAEEQLNNLLQHPEAGEKLNKYYLSSRSLLLDYLRQSGIGNHDKKAAIVDLRGSRASQKSINTLLRTEGLPEVDAYYFEVLRDRKSIKEAGNYRAWIYDEKYPDQKGIGAITRMGDILEEYFCVTDEGRTISYRHDGSTILPVTTTPNDDATHKRALEEHIKACRKFAAIFIKNRLYRNTDRVTTIVLRRAAEFAEAPEYQFLPTISKFSQREKPLVEKIRVSHLSGHRYAWRNGSLAFTLGPHLQWLLSPLKKTAGLMARILRK